VKALLLVAGMGTRLGGYTRNHPKSLLLILGRPILFHIVDRIILNGIKDFVVVVGFQKEKIITALKTEYPAISFTFVENTVYNTTNTMYSMWLSRLAIAHEGFVYFHGDVIFNKNILKKLLNPQYVNGAVVEPHQECMEVFGFNGAITRISKKKDSIGKALGVYKFSPEAAARVFEEAGRLIHAGKTNVFQSEAINPTIVLHKMDMVTTDDLGWVEVDDESDLFEGEAILRRILEEESMMKQNSPMVKEELSLVKEELP
jgi:choline kinase